MIPKHCVIQYVRKKRTPYGVIVAVKNNDGGYNLGYSLCNKKDRFTKRMALEIAIGRANTINFDADNHPHEIKKMISTFVERCKKYYKS